MNYKKPDLLIKKLSKKFNLKQIKQMLLNIYTDKEEYFCIASIIGSEIELLNDKIHHIYIDDNTLFNFLVKINVSNDINIPIQFTDFKKDDGFFLVEKGLHNSFIIYFKNKEPLLLRWYADKNVKENIFVYNYFKEFHKKSFNKNNINQNYMNENILLKFFINLMAYIEAFPEILKDGIPKDFVLPFNKKFKQTKNITIGKNKKISDSNDRMPHARSGHFRRLNSDYYKYKKGQVVWVKKCMILGKAKTVIEA